MGRSSSLFFRSKLLFPPSRFLAWESALFHSLPPPASSKSLARSIRAPSKRLRRRVPAPLSLRSPRFSFPPLFFSRSPGTALNGQQCRAWVFSIACSRQQDVVDFYFFFLPSSLADGSAERAASSSAPLLRVTAIPFSPFARYAFVPVRSSFSDPAQRDHDNFAPIPLPWSELGFEALNFPPTRRHGGDPRALSLGRANALSFSELISLFSFLF